MEFKYPNTKKLYVTVEISRLLYKYNCTFKEADDILDLINGEIKQQRENLEYNTFDDLMARRKNRYVDNDVIQPLNHVAPYG